MRTSPKHAAQNISPHVSHAKLARDTAPRPCAQNWHRSSSGTEAESGGTVSRKEFRRPTETPMSGRKSACKFSHSCLTIMNHPYEDGKVLMSRHGVSQKGPL